MVGTGPGALDTGPWPSERRRQHVLGPRQACPSCCVWLSCASQMCFLQMKAPPPPAERPRLLRWVAGANPPRL